jgi:hypothetical protein
MEPMEAFDPICFEAWIRENFTNGADLNGGGQSLALQSLMTNAVMDPQVTILSQKDDVSPAESSHHRDFPFAISFRGMGTDRCQAASHFSSAWSLRLLITRGRSLAGPVVLSTPCRSIR